MVVKIEERWMESLRKKWEDAKRTKLEYYIANVNPKCWSQYKARMPIERCREDFQPRAETRGRRANQRCATSAHNGDRKACVGRGSTL